jgi:hypothetical protein
MREAQRPITRIRSDHRRTRFAHSIRAHINQFVSPGGLTLAQLHEIIRLVRERCVLPAAAITADPEREQDGKAVKAAVASFHWRGEKRTGTKWRIYEELGARRK